MCSCQGSLQGMLHCHNGQSPNAWVLEIVRAVALQRWQCTPRAKSSCVHPKLSAARTMYTSRQAAFSTTARPTATQSVRIAPLHQHVQLRRCVQARASGGDQLVDSLLANIPNAVVRTAIKEPVAFLGGAFAGALGLDITQEPLRSWVERTHAQAGVPLPPELQPPAAQDQRSSQR